MHSAWPLIILLDNLNSATCCAADAILGIVQCLLHTLPLPLQLTTGKRLRCVVCRALDWVVLKVWIYYEELIEGIEPIRCCWDASCNLEEAIQSITTRFVPLYQVRASTLLVACRAGWGDRGPRVWSIYDVHGVVLYPTAVASCEAVVHFAFEDNQVSVSCNSLQSL